MILGNDKIKLHQDIYILRILEQSGMKGCKAVSMKMNFSTLRSDIDEKPVDSQAPYANLVDKLLNLSNQTRPNITYSVSSWHYLLHSR